MRKPTSAIEGKFLLHLHTLGVKIIYPVHVTQNMLGQDEDYLKNYFEKRKLVS